MSDALSTIGSAAVSTIGTVAVVDATAKVVGKSIGGMNRGTRRGGTRTRKSGNRRVNSGTRRRSNSLLGF